MEVEDPECVESDPEEEGQPDNEAMIQDGAAGEEEDEKEDEEGQESGSDEEQQVKISVDEEDWHSCSEDEEEKGTDGSSSKSSFHNSSRLLHKEELLEVFKAAHSGPRCKEGELTVGLVSEKLTLYNQLENACCEVTL